jgi:acetate kinase
VHGPLGPELLATLAAGAPGAPQHTPDALALVRACALEFPAALQVACDDSQFHAALPPMARTLPLPAALRAPGLVRLGFHGLSCQAVLRQLGAATPRRLVIAHLGQGASVTAVREGQSVDTSMGLTPLGGCLMATRSGDLDPGVLLHLLRQHPADTEGLTRLLGEQSGLLGISGLSGDLRQLRPAANAGHAGAQLAIACFARAVAKQVAGMACVLGGLDLLVFTGGMAEHDAGLRAAICEDLHWTGLRLDAERNRDSLHPLSSADSACAVRWLPCRENEEIAHQAAHALATQRATAQAVAALASEVRASDVHASAAPASAAH